MPRSPTASVSPFYRGERCGPGTLGTCSKDVSELGFDSQCHAMATPALRSGDWRSSAGDGSFYAEAQDQGGNARLSLRCLVPGCSQDTAGLASQRSRPQRPPVTLREPGSLDDRSVLDDPISLGLIVLLLSSFKEARCPWK